MNLKKKFREFFSLARKGNGGFTLVELIVVIAILAILAGVAVPAYSGYVTKAERAADEALLADLNMAFASACAINGEDHIGRTDVTNQVIANGELDYVGVHEEDVENFFEGGVFKCITALVYNSESGMFIAGTAVGNGFVVSDEDLAKILSSVWADTEAEDLLNMVGLGAEVVSQMDDFDALVNNPAFAEAASKLLGKDYDEYWQLKAVDAAEKYCAENGLDVDDDWDTAWDAVAADVKKNIDSNLMVIISAKEAQNAGKDILTNLQSSNPKDLLVGNLGTDPSIGLSQSALTFGLYTAYKGEDANVLDMIKDLEDPNSGFRKDYLKGNQVEKDLDGLLAAMNVINDQNSDVIQSTVENGITNPNVLAALEAIIGQKS